MTTIKMISTNNVVIFFSLLSLAISLKDCVENAPMRDFHKVRSCFRSKSSIIARADVQNVSHCVDFAIRRGGLAFNFSPTSAEILGRRNGYFYNCQILGCPEIANNASELVKDSRFDYYSVFGNFNSTENATCIKSVGLFVLNKNKENYTTAASSCQEIGGELAHVVSESRTNGLSAVLDNGINDWYKAAYVGLDDCENEGTFVTPLGNPLECFTYRAWAPGHPRGKFKNSDCVILDNDRSWRVINCNHKLPSVCELFPQMIDFVENELFVKPNCTDIKNKKELRKCLEKERKYEILQNSTREEKCELLDD